MDRYLVSSKATPKRRRKLVVPFLLELPQVVLVLVSQFLECPAILLGVNRALSAQVETFFWNFVRGMDDESWLEQRLDALTLAAFAGLVWVEVENDQFPSLK